MALKRLAGPFPLKTLDGRLCRIPVPVYLWADEYEGVLCRAEFARSGGLSSNEVYGACIMQLDGTVLFRNTAAAGSFFYDHAKRKLAGSGPEAGYYRDIDWWTLKSVPTSQHIAYSETIFEGTYVGARSGLYLNDRIVFEFQRWNDPIPRLYSMSYTHGDLPTIEYSLQTRPTSSPYGFPAYEEWSTKFIPSGKNDRTAFLLGGMWYEQGGSRACEYDFVAKQVVGWVRRLGAQPDLNEPAIVGYVPKLKVWLVIDHDWYTEPVSSVYSQYGRLSIYADEPVPAILSKPVALTPPRSGEVTRFKVRLTGADDDPCAGHRINWTCSSRGTVIDPQTVTDADGYAETRIAFSPRATGPQEGVTVTAEVIF